MENTGHDLGFFHDKTLLEVEEYRRQKAARIAAKKEAEQKAKVQVTS